MTDSLTVSKDFFGWGWFSSALQAAGGRTMADIHWKKLNNCSREELIPMVLMVQATGAE